MFLTWLPYTATKTPTSFFRGTQTLIYDFQPPNFDWLGLMIRSWVIVSVRTWVRITGRVMVGVRVSIVLREG